MSHRAVATDAVWSFGTSPELTRALGELRYRSPFGNWSRRASVRTKPERSLPGNEVDVHDALFFSPELVPVVHHPLVLERGQRARWEMLVRRLHAYLHFTTELEQLTVIPLAGRLGRGNAGLPLPEGMRQDAFRIVTDEAWHAQFSYGMMLDLEQRTGVAPVLSPVPHFVSRLDEIRARLAPEVRGLEALLFGIVSETLISAILADLPRDERLPGPVRDLVADHAEDEGRHHAYFRLLLTLVWPALTPREQSLAGRVVPDIVRAFLEPDYTTIGMMLRATGFDVAETEQILIESYPAASVTAEISTGSKAFTRYFEDVGALDDPAIADAFRAAGLRADGGQTRTRRAQHLTVPQVS
jgi:hypothetical protein